MENIDSALDQVGIVLDHPMICGNCVTQMDSLSNNIFKCPKCGYLYKDN